MSLIPNDKDKACMLDAFEASGCIVTPAEAAVLASLRAGTHVCVPKIDINHTRAGYDGLGYMRWSPTACRRCGYERMDCTCPVGFAAAPEPQP